MIKELNVLRIFFMLFIFLEHSAYMEGGGYLGVALFFILGGFCMMLGYGEKVQSESFSYRKYLVRRLTKFYPFHWICLVAWVVMTLASQLPIGGIGELLANVCLVQSWIPQSKFYFSFNGISWYLSNTVFYTVVFPFFARQILYRTRSRNVLFVLCLTAFYVLVCVLTPEDKRHAILYIHPLVRLADFVLGCYLAKAFVWLRGRIHTFDASKMVMGYVTSIVSIVLLIMQLRWCKDCLQFSCIFWPLASVTIMSTALASAYRQDRDSRFLETASRIGGYSFYFYMVHQMAIQVCNSIAHKVHFEYHFTVMIVTLLISSLIAVACRKWIDEKIQNKLKTLGAYE